MPKPIPNDSSRNPSIPNVGDFPVPIGIGALDRVSELGCAPKSNRSSSPGFNTARKLKGVVALYPSGDAIVRLYSPFSRDSKQVNPSSSGSGGCFLKSHPMVCQLSTKHLQSGR